MYLVKSRLYLVPARNKIHGVKDVVKKSRQGLPGEIQTCAPQARFIHLFIQNVKKVEAKNQQCAKSNALNELHRFTARWAPFGCKRECKKQTRNFRDLPFRE